MSEKDKAEEYKRRLEAYEAEAAKDAKLFDAKELARKTNIIRSVEHPTLGVIRYGVLTYGDLAEIQRQVKKHGESQEEIAATMVWLMLRKAQPSLTREEVLALPFDVTAELIKMLTRDTGFLAQAGTASADGSNATVKPRKQG